MLLFFSFFLGVVLYVGVIPCICFLANGVDVVVIYFAVVVLVPLPVCDVNFLTEDVVIVVVVVVLVLVIVVLIIIVAVILVVMYIVLPVVVLLLLLVVVVVVLLLLLF